jgi:endonuclease YncB( thermonuclease family)
MQFLPSVAAAAMAAIQLLSPITRSDPVLVRTVIDGDTIDVGSVGRVRLLGIDAPELGRGFDTSAPFGQEARARLTSLLLHRWVRLEQEGARLDVYDRHLAYVVREDGVFVNAVLVREGLARVSARAPLSRLSELKGAEAEAQNFRRGMWGAAPQIPASGYTSKSSEPRPRRVRVPRAAAPAGTHSKKPRTPSKRKKKST